MENNAMIKRISYYHPEHIVDNEFFIEHFKKKGEDIEGLLKTTGRKTRYISDKEEENILTMGYQAAKDVLAKAYVKPSQIGMLIFSSGTPEYMLPPNSVKMHAMLGIGQKCCVYDLNANCAGMVVALDQASRVMQSNPNIKYALIIGSDQLNRYSRYDEALAYSNFGDSACAMILENVFHTDRGLLDSDYYTNSSNHDKMVFPAKGLSCVMRERGLPDEDKLEWIPFDYSGAFHSASISIEEMLFRNNLTKDEIKKYFLSQFSWTSIERVCEELREDIRKFTFVGDEFGYTGTTSPMLACARAMENGELRSGDNIIFWTVGAGTTCACALYKC